jgi:hypothetical protein
MDTKSAPPSASQSPAGNAIWQAVKRTPGLIAGGAVDAANLALGLLAGKGFDGLSAKPVGGGEWINEQFGMSASKDALQAGTEAALSMLSPGGMAKAMIVPAFAIKKLGDVRTAEKILAASRPTKAAQDQAWSAVGIYKDPTDKQLKTVIPDTGASIRADALAAGDITKSPTSWPNLPYDAWYGAPPRGSNVKVGDILEHPELFSKQPYLADIKLNEGLFMLPGNASFNPNTNTILMGPSAGQTDFVSTLLHELQHGVQTNYGFTPGGNPGMFVADQAAVDRGRKILEKAQNQAKIENMPPELIKFLEDYEATLRNVNTNATLNYKRLGGEVEARTVEHMFRTNDYTKNPANLVTEVLKSTPFNRAIASPEKVEKADTGMQVQSILQNLDILYDSLLKGWAKP